MWTPFKKKKRGRKFTDAEAQLGHLTQQLQRQIKENQDFNRISKMQQMLDQNQQPQQPNTATQMTGLMQELSNIKQIVQMVWGVDLDNMPSSEGSGEEDFLKSMLLSRMQQTPVQQPPVLVPPQAQNAAPEPAPTPKKRKR